MLTLFDYDMVWCMFWHGVHYTGFYTGFFSGSGKYDACRVSPPRGAWGIALRLLLGSWKLASNKLLGTRTLHATRLVALLPTQQSTSKFWGGSQSLPPPSPLPIWNPAVETGNEGSSHCDPLADCAVDYHCSLLLLYISLITMLCRLERTAARPWSTWRSSLRAPIKMTWWSMLLLPWVVGTWNWQFSCQREKTSMSGLLSIVS